MHGRVLIFLENIEPKCRQPGLALILEFYIVLMHLSSGWVTCSFVLFFWVDVHILVIHDHISLVVYGRLIYDK